MKLPTRYAARLLIAATVLAVLSGPLPVASADEPRLAKSSGIRPHFTTGCDSQRLLCIPAADYQDGAHARLTQFLPPTTTCSNPSLARDWAVRGGRWVHLGSSGICSSADPNGEPPFPRTLRVLRPRALVLPCLTGRMLCVDASLVPYDPWRQLTVDGARRSDGCQQETRHGRAPRRAVWLPAQGRVNCDFAGAHPPTLALSASASTVGAAAAVAATEREEGL